MEGGSPKPCARNQTRAAILGAGAALALIWGALIGYSLYRGQTDDAVLWLAIAVATLTAILLPLVDQGDRK